MLKRPLLKLFILLGNVLLLLMLEAACSPIFSNMHSTYLYHGPDGFDGNRHSGDHIVVNWQAKRGPDTSDPTPTSISLNVELVGPFSSIDDFLVAVRQSSATNNSFPKEFIVASAKSILTNNWTNKSFSNALIIPPNLKTDYYDLFYTETLIKNGKIINTVTRADAPFKINLP